MDVLVLHDLPVAEAIGERRPDLAVVAADSGADAGERLPAADAFVTNTLHWDDAFLEGLEAGDWVQTTSAGYAAFPVEAFEERGVAFSTSAGLTAPTVAEHAFALALSFSRGIPRYVDRQREAEWNRSDSTALSDWSGATLTVVGLGNIGEEVARRGLGFGLSVYGVKRDPDAYDGRVARDRVLAPGELESVLPETDLLVLCVPLTDETRGLVDESVLAALPETAVVVNVSRGPVVDQAALIDALEADSIGGAGLDVFETEPLPADSPLWDHERVVITPHVAGRSDAFVPRFVDLFLENAERRAAGKPLRNQLAGP